MSIDVFDLYAKLSLDTSEYDKAMGDSRKSAQSFSSDMGDAGKSASIFSDVLSANLVTKGISIAVSGLQKLGAVAVDTFKQAISGFAEFEQLAGGTQLVFGEAYDFIMAKASEAYETVQMSQNEYLQQVNGFAVGLKEALGGNEQAAAELADKIITAEADVVAAMGVSQEAAQNAFNGIMKGNYTMVDNLQLGINATKEGVESMIDKVNDWNESQGKSTKYTIDNVADVQSALVDYIEMQGLAGYASKEATGTISGSIASVKAAYHNLVNGLADDNADIDKLMDDLVKAANTAFDALAPVAERALEGLIDMAIHFLPKFADLGMKIIGAIVKGILMAPFDILGSILKALGIQDNLRSFFGFSEPSLGYRANGGFMQAGQPYKVGEFGEEIVVPAQNSYAYTARETAGMSGRNITININGDVYDDQRSLQNKIRGAVLNVIDTELAYG